MTKALESLLFGNCQNRAERRTGEHRKGGLNVEQGRSASVSRNTVQFRLMIFVGFVAGSLSSEKGSLPVSLGACSID